MGFVSRSLKLIVFLKAFSMCRSLYYKLVIEDNEMKKRNSKQAPDRVTKSLFT